MASRVEHNSPRPYPHTLPGKMTPVSCLLPLQLNVITQYKCLHLFPPKDLAADQKMFWQEVKIGLVPFRKQTLGNKIPSSSCCFFAWFVSLTFSVLSALAWSVSSSRGRNLPGGLLRWSRWGCSDVYACPTLHSPTPPIVYVCMSLKMYRRSKCFAALKYRSITYSWQVI